MSEATGAGQEQFDGAVVSGVSEGAYFVRLDWVRSAIRRLAGFDPYPGTLNLRLLNADSLPRWRKIRKDAGVSLASPEPESCGGRLVPALVEDRIQAAVVVPDVTRYGEELLEIIAPVHLRTRLGLQDGDLVRLTIPSRGQGQLPFSTAPGGARS